MPVQTVAQPPPESDKITPYQWKIMYASVAGYVFDGMDSILFVLVLPMIMKEFALTPDIAGLMVTIFLCGQVVGGLLMGVISDYIGRRNTMMLTVMTYAISTACCGFASSWQMLAFFRFFTGFGCVGEWSAAATLIAETWPAKHRSKCASVMQSCWAWGSILGSFVVMIVAPLWGWRAVFFVGVVPALIVLYIRKTIRETERFDRLVEIRADAKAKGIKTKETSFTVFQLFSEKKLVKHVFIGIAMTSAELIVCWAILTFAPTYLVTVKGYSIVKSSGWFVAFNLGAGIGYLAWGPIADKIGRKPTFLIYILISLIFTPLYLLWAPNMFWLCILGPLAGFGGLGIYSGFTTYYPELFPTRLRGTGTAFAPQLGRVISVAGPWVIGSLAMTYGYGVAISLACLTWFWALLGLAFAPETKGMSLEEITE